LPFPVGKIQQQGFIIGVINGPRSLNLNRCIKTSYGRHAFDRDAEITDYPFVSLVRIVCPFRIVHELLEGICHIPEDIPFGCLHAVGIDDHLAEKFLSGCVEDGK
jgi:hypothetical protein